MLRIERLVAERTGLQMRRREREALRQIVTARETRASGEDAEQYEQMLREDSRSSEQEWARLIGRVTNRESYFFRDPGQMTALRETVLPALVKANVHRRRLRIWSAGCATGEEAYSIAILLAELLPPDRSAAASAWDISILGTDIALDALEHARRGVYPAWSFRAVEPAERQQFFVREGAGWAVADRIRSAVTFRPCNLVHDPFPDRGAGLFGIDLIVCRNVFIYFAQPTVEAVAAKFARTLSDDGYLMTGHSEMRRPIAGLTAESCPGSVVFRRDALSGTLSPEATGRTHLITPRATPGPEETARRPLPTTPPSAKVGAAGGPLHHVTPPSAAIAGATAGRPLQIAPEAGPHADEIASAGRGRRGPEAAGARARHELTPIVDAAPARVRHLASEAVGASAEAPAGPVGHSAQHSAAPAGAASLLLLAREHADAGRHGDAVHVCRELITRDPDNAAPYELLALLAEDGGRYEEAVALLQKALYLEPESPNLYAGLGGLYARTGRLARARTMWRSAVDLLEILPPDRLIGLPPGRPAAEWIRSLRPLLAEGA